MLHRGMDGAGLAQGKGPDLGDSPISISAARGFLFLEFHGTVSLLLISEIDHVVRREASMGHAVKSPVSFITAPVDLNALGLRQCDVFVTSIDGNANNVGIGLAFPMGHTAHPGIECAYFALIGSAAGGDLVIGEVREVKTLMDTLATGGVSSCQVAHHHEVGLGNACKQEGSLDDGGQHCDEELVVAVLVELQ